MDADAQARFLDRAPCGFLSFDDDGTLLYVNATLADMLGAPAHSLVGKRVDEILTVSSRIFYQTHFFPLLKLHGHAEEIYITLRSASGEHLHALTNAVRRNGDDGQSTTDCVILRIKEREKYEVELIRGRKAAEEANKAKTRFLSMMSHDLRTPLNAVVGYSELLLMGIRGPLTPDQKSDLERIQRATRFLLTLLGDILDLARAESKELPLTIGPTRLDLVLTEVEQIMAPRFQEVGLSYSRVCEGSRQVNADPDRLKQILLNLLTNAAKFTKPPGKVWIDCVDDGSSVSIRVADTGRGIPADSLERIFEPFVQVQQVADAKNQRGVGLGLAISRELARVMGGDLSVESAIAQGSTFAISLPAVADPTA